MILKRDYDSVHRNVTENENQQNRGEHQPIDLKILPDDIPPIFFPAPSFPSLSPMGAAHILHYPQHSTAFFFQQVPAISLKYKMFRSL